MIYCRVRRIRLFVGGCKGSVSHSHTLAKTAPPAYCKRVKTSGGQETDFTGTTANMHFMNMDLVVNIDAVAFIGRAFNVRIVCILKPIPTPSQRGLQTSSIPSGLRDMLHVRGTRSQTFVQRCHNMYVLPSLCTRHRRSINHVATRLVRFDARGLPCHMWPPWVRAIIDSNQQF